MIFNALKPKQNFTWNINCSNGDKAIITAQLNGSTRDPINIIVDYKKLTTNDSNSAKYEKWGGWFEALV